MAQLLIYVRLVDVHTGAIVFEQTIADVDLIVAAAELAAERALDYLATTGRGVMVAIHDGDGIAP